MFPERSHCKLNHCPSVKYKLTTVLYANTPYLPVSLGFDIGPLPDIGPLVLVNEHLILQAPDILVVSCHLIGWCC